MVNADHFVPWPQRIDAATASERDKLAHWLHETARRIELGYRTGYALEDLRLIAEVAPDVLGDPLDDNGWSREWFERWLTRETLP